MCASVVLPSSSDASQDRGGAVAGGRRWEGVPAGTKLLPVSGEMGPTGCTIGARTMSGLVGETAPAVLHEPTH